MSAQRSRAGTVRQRGFTLIEVMVVLVILGLIAAAVATNVFDAHKNAQIERARLDFHTISNAVDVYRLRHDRPPEALQALVEQGQLKSLPHDPWGAAYLYERVSTGDGYRITTLGRDGVAGGEGVDADLHSDDPEPR
jgi:general secretion pathway protein G